MYFALLHVGHCHACIWSQSKTYRTYMCTCTCGKIFPILCAQRKTPPRNNIFVTFQAVTIYCCIIQQPPMAYVHVHTGHLQKRWESLPSDLAHKRQCNPHEKYICSATCHHLQTCLCTCIHKYMYTYIREMHVHCVNLYFKANSSQNKFLNEETILVLYTLKK